MARTKRLRKIVAPPSFTSFMPIGIDLEEKDSIELLYEEYEAIKLADYNSMNHQEAAVLMGVSRPTFARIYKSARQKIAKALVEVCELKTSYGNAWMESGWFKCKQCSGKFTIPITLRAKECPLCKSCQIENINE